MDAIAGVAPEPIQEHWVHIEGRRYPPKQVYQLLTDIPRAAFTSHRALAHLRSLGLQTSVYTPKTKATQEIVTETPAVEQSLDSAQSFATLSAFMSMISLTGLLSSAEASLAGADAADCSSVVAEFGFSEDLLDAALSVRKHVGRLSDVIHATTISRCLPLILESNETVTVRPSLGAGNDPSRPFDLETDRRIAEFKVAQWKGADTMRKRGLFADLVHLALDQSGRRAQLFVVGELPRKFLTTSKSSVHWALARSSPHLRTRFTDAFGTDEMTVAEFTSGPGQAVELVDLAKLLPSLAASDDLSAQR
ncbi:MULTISPECIES: PE-PGRS family protein [Rhodococcus]|uniref:PE-PGRS family protein n=1 Tax=Nocardiaceae TaxID=85025 RepID=UPI0012ECE287|nr:MULTISPECIES: PE-PGRS family protein [Rhodococcus]